MYQRQYKTLPDIEQHKNDQFLHLLLKINRQKLYDQIISMAASQYNIRNWKLNQITPEDIINIYKDMRVKKSYQQKIEERKQKYHEDYQQWEQNQLRIFIIILLFYTHDQNKTIEQMEEHDWELFCQAFQKNDYRILKYEARLILKKIKRANKWTRNQEEIFEQIFNNYKQERNLKQFCVKWKRIGCQMYCCSDQQFYRTPKQIREHWINHLDTSKTKEPWSLQEDVSLLSNIKKLGKKWSQISKIIKNRTEHMVKNRFNFLMREQFGDSEIGQTSLIQKLLKKLQKKLPRILKNKTKPPVIPETPPKINRIDLQQQIIDIDNFLKSPHEIKFQQQNDDQIMLGSHEKFLANEIDCLINLNRQFQDSHSLI